SKTLFFASQRVWRSDDRGDSWRPLCCDLTRILPRLHQPMMGRVWSFDAMWDLLAMSKYGTITALDQSPLDAKLLVAGTDDGLIRVSEDGGEHWQMTEHLPGVKDLFFVNDVKADRHDKNTLYAAVDQHKTGDFAPYLFKSTDRGRTWRSMATGLPPRHIVWRIVQDHVKPGLMFAGTEFGVFFTLDGGGAWTKLKGNMPTIPFRDLAIQRRENDLVAASFGRGFYILDDYTPLREATPEMLAKEAVLFKPRTTRWYTERRVLGGGEKAFQGDAYYGAPNPPFGAVFTYYLKDELKTKKAARRDKEKELEKTGGDTPMPGWDALRAEALEEDPTIICTVRDSQGRVVRRVLGPAKAGFQRVAWDLTFPTVDAAGGAPAVDEESGRVPRGRMAPPGTYSVSLAKRVDGVVTELAGPQSFEVVEMRKGTLPTPPAVEVAALWQDVNDLDRALRSATAALAGATQRVKAMKEALNRSTTPDTKLDDRARAIERKLADLDLRLNGDFEREENFNEGGPISIANRIRTATRTSASYGPTPNLRSSLEVGKQEFATLRAELDALLSGELPALEKDLDAAGVPWTPGRGVGR
ncbi:MAG: glycosyl hydrolase, partial [Candidatus Eisenbacteria bacterium]